MHSDKRFRGNGEMVFKGVKQKGGGERDKEIHCEGDKDRKWRGKWTLSFKASSCGRDQVNIKYRFFYNFLIPEDDTKYNIKSVYILSLPHLVKEICPIFK